MREKLRVMVYSKINFDTKILNNSDAYYHDRGGRRSELHSRAAAASEASTLYDSRSIASELSPQQERFIISGSY